MTDDLVARARRLIGDNQYLTLATSDADGRPWASPVWYVAVDRSTPERFAVELVWLSYPLAQHSQNLATRPEVGIAVFDSTQPAGTGDGVQISATAQQVPDDELDDTVAVFSEASLAAGGDAWTRDQVEEPSVPRLYVARVEAAYVLGDRARVSVPV